MAGRTVAVIQARMGSTRFPGKMLADLGGHALLEWVLRRVSVAATLDGTVLATTTGAADDPLANLAAALGMQVFRGHESDVLGRFVAAADAERAGCVVRVCADNPFVDPGEIDRLVRFHNDGGFDYSCNHLDRLGSHYADGFGAEILGTEILRRVDSLAVDTKHREHVTLYLWDRPQLFRMAAVPAPPELAHPGLRFDIDTPADLERLARLVERGIRLDATAAQIVELALENHSSS